MVVFLAKYDRLISTEKGRAKDALQFFLEINNNIGSDSSKKKYFDFIDRIVYMQIEGVEDEGAAFDYNQKYFKNLVEAKANLNGIRRRIEGSNFGSKPLIDESYVRGVKERYDELIKEWFHKEGDSISLSQVGQNLKKELEQQFSLLKDIDYAHGMRYGGLGKYIPTSVHQE
ncbi:hypothetical protein CTS44_00474 [Comamonas thiooxydans]|nr:hypothetical protein CTS44_00474 [Comamonas thiooxydans]